MLYESTRAIVGCFAMHLRELMTSNKINENQNTLLFSFNVTRQITLGNLTKMMEFLNLG